MQEGVVAGGGTAPINAIPAGARPRHAGGRRAHRCQDRAEGSEAPLRQIAKNAGLEGSVIIDKIVPANKPNYGFDAQNEVFVEDMIAAGIVDPTKVHPFRSGERSLVAEMVLTTESLLPTCRNPFRPASGTRRR